MLVVPSLYLSHPWILFLLQPVILFIGFRRREILVISWCGIKRNTRHRIPLKRWNSTRIQHSFPSQIFLLSWSCNRPHEATPCFALHRTTGPRIWRKPRALFCVKSVSHHSTLVRVWTAWKNPLASSLGLDPHRVTTELIRFLFESCKARLKTFIPLLLVHLMFKGPTILHVLQWPQSSFLV